MAETKSRPRRKASDAQFSKTAESDRAHQKTPGELKTRELGVQKREVISNEYLLNVLESSGVDIAKELAVIFSNPNVETKDKLQALRLLMARVSPSSRPVSVAREDQVINVYINISNDPDPVSRN